MGGIAVTFGLQKYGQSLTGMTVAQRREEIRLSVGTLNDETLYGMIRFWDWLSEGEGMMLLQGYVMCFLYYFYFKHHFSAIWREWCDLYTQLSTFFSANWGWRFFVFNFFWLLERVMVTPQVSIASIKTMGAWPSIGKFWKMEEPGTNDNDGGKRAWLCAGNSEKSCWRN